MLARSLRVLITNLAAKVRPRNKTSAIHFVRAALHRQYHQYLVLSIGTSWPNTTPNMSDNGSVNGWILNSVTVTARASFLTLQQVWCMWLCEGSPNNGVPNPYRDTGNERTIPITIHNWCCCFFVAGIRVKSLRRLNLASDEPPPHQKTNKSFLHSRQRQTPTSCWSDGPWMQHRIILTRVKGRLPLEKLPSEMRDKMESSGQRKSRVNFLIFPLHYWW